jgi:hypothetical protein
MASFTLSPVWGAGAQLFDNSGNVLTGGKIETFAAGTTTPAPTYTTPVGNIFNSNPIIADASGRLSNEIWLEVGRSYKFVLRDSNNVLIATYDYIPSLTSAPISNDASSIAYEQGYQVTAGAFTVGATYLINSIGTTDFTLIGAAANVVGLHFVATGVGSGNGTALFSRTVQTRLRENVSLKDFGAVGDGVTNDTAAVQQCWNFAIANNRSVYVPAGVYRIGQTFIAYGMEIVGEAGATFKLLDNQPSFTRMLTTQNNLWASTSPTEDSPPLIIRNLILDGNQLNQGPYTGFQKEQQHAIFLNGSGDTNTGNYRLRAIIENCTFKATCGEGVSVYRSVDVDVSNCFFWNCFRGSVTNTGANSIIRANNLSAGGNLHTSFFQAEIDGAVNGLTNGKITLTNSFFDALKLAPTTGVGLDIAVGAGSQVTVSNCIFNAGITNIYGEDATTSILFSNCYFRQLQGDDNCVRYGRLKFDNCYFSHPSVNTSGQTITVRQFTRTNLLAEFNNCEFYLEYDPLASVTSVDITVATVINDGLIEFDTATPHGISAPGNFGYTLVKFTGFNEPDYNRTFWVAAVPSPTQIRIATTKNVGTPTFSAASLKIVPQISAVRSNFDQREFNNITYINGGTVGPNYSHVIKHSQGGFSIIKNVNVESFALAFLSSGSNLSSVIKVGQNNYSSNFSLFGFAIASGASSATTIFWDGCSMPAESYFIRFGVGSTAALVLNGKRTLQGNYNPSNGYQKLISDVWVNNNAGVSVPTQYNPTVTSVSTTAPAGEWLATTWTMGRNTTANRPTLTAVDRGVTYMDTTLDADGKVIWWNGTAWVDATGAVV